MSDEKGVDQSKKVLGEEHRVQISTIQFKDQRIRHFQARSALPGWVVKVACGDIGVVGKVKHIFEKRLPDHFICEECLGNYLAQKSIARMLEPSCHLVEAKINRANFFGGKVWNGEIWRVVGEDDAEEAVILELPSRKSRNG